MVFPLVEIFSAKSGFVNQVSKFQGFKVSRFQGFKVSRFQMFQGEKQNLNSNAKALSLDSRGQNRRARSG